LDQPLIVLDTERANAQGVPHLLELAAVRVLEGEVQDSFDSLVRPEVPIDPLTEAYHGLTDADVRDAPPAHEVLASFVEWIGEDWLAAHDARADGRVLGFELSRAGLTPWPRNPILDVLATSREWLPEAPDHKLATLTEWLELEGTPSHRALPDAVAAWQVLEACLQRARGQDPMASYATFMGRRATTLESCAPPEPHLPRRLKSLRAACAEESEVRLLYGDSSGHPSQLPVRPRFLYKHKDKGYLEAECTMSGLVKTYRLDRVRRVLT